MELMFQLGSEVVVVKIEGHKLTFATSSTNFQKFVPIEMLELSVSGILKEHPDLEQLPEKEMKQEAIRRFKEKVKNMQNENEIKDYVQKELEGCGYILKTIKREGFRPTKLK